MTTDDFDKFNWGAGLEVKYDGEKYEIVSVNFYEKLIGLCDVSIKLPEDGDIQWVRCENVEVLND